MAKRVGVFSDIHGSWNNLELITQTFKELGIDSSMFLGDAIYDTASSVSSHATKQGIKIRELLRQKSDLRDDIVEEGVYSDSQLERMAKLYGDNLELSKKVARAEYTTMKDILKDLEMTVLGGNWDYEEEIKDIFNEEYLNASLTEINGLKVAGFSGGGTPVNVNFPEQTLADNQRDKKYQFKSWHDFLLKNREIDADVYVSHVPPTSGEGVETENAIEHLKEAILIRKSKGLGVPGLYMFGHEHSMGEVKYDEELDGILLSPGASSSNHTTNASPTFMTAEFDDDNKIQKVMKYELRSSLEGLKNVVLTEEYTINHDATNIKDKVKCENKNETIISEADPRKLTDNLSLDDMHSALQGGISRNYSELDTVEKDKLLRKNIAIMFEDVKKNSEVMEDIIKASIFKYSSEDGKLNSSQVKSMIDDCYKNLSDKALEKFNANIDHVDEREQGIFRDIMLQVAFGIKPGELSEVLRRKPITSIDSMISKSKGLVESATKDFSGRYQNFLLNRDDEDNPSTKDYQEMAELYMPNNFERKKALSKEEAFGFWVDTYQKGFLTSGDMVELDFAYEKKEDYVKNTKTKEELSDMFKFKYTPINAEEEVSEEITGESEVQIDDIVEELESKRDHMSDQIEKLKQYRDLEKGIGINGPFKNPRVVGDSTIGDDMVKRRMDSLGQQGISLESDLQEDYIPRDTISPTSL